VFPRSWKYVEASETFKNRMEINNISKSS